MKNLIKKAQSSFKPYSKMIKYKMQHFNPEIRNEAHHNWTKQQILEACDIFIERLSNDLRDTIEKQKKEAESIKQYHIKEGTLNYPKYFDGYFDALDSLLNRI